MSRADAQRRGERKQQIIIKRNIQMKIHNLKAYSMNAWEDLFCRIDSIKHWKEGRSAQSLAEFILERNGEREIIEAVNPVLYNDNVDALTDAVIECNCSFDRYPTPRRQDMGIWGKTVNGKRLFIGVEAKVDESFGPTVSEAISEAITYRNQHPKSKRFDRITELCQNFGVTVEEVGQFRYQLFHYAAGTASVPGIDIHIMLTLVFKTGEYNESNGSQNELDYERFIERFFEKKNGRCQLKKSTLPARPYAIYHIVDLRG